MTEVIQKRRSIRKYQTDKPVSKEQLNQLMEAAMLAPSACNTRPWEFIAITNRNILKELANIHRYAKMFNTAMAAIVVVGIPQVNEVARDFFPQDCGAATQNILLEACAMGLGTCWCGVYPKEDIMASVSTLLGIVEPKVPFNLIAIGVPDESPACRGYFDESKVTFME